VIRDIHETGSIKNPRKLMTTVYVASLSLIAVLSIITHFVLDQVIKEQSQTGMLVNKSGQQRMLSQRITMFTIEYEQTGLEDAKNSAELSLTKMQQNHSDLLAEHYEAVANNRKSPLSAKMQTLYFDGPNQVDEQLKTFSQLILEALQQPEQTDNRSNNVDKPYFEMATKQFLDSLNNVVSQYEIESLEKVSRLTFAQNVVLIVVIITILLEGLYVFRPMVIRISEFAERLQHDATHDHLSNIYNRRAFFLISEKLLRYAQRYKKPCSVVLFDIDKFKSINDNYGHDIGDAVIQEIASLLAANIRSADILARFGGEEFVLLLAETNHENATLVAEKIKRSVEEALFSSKKLLVTVSGGVATCDEHQTLHATIKNADEQLYKAKNSGRNRIC